ncbi:MAG TPA: hypothetical protein PLJ85_05465, partial [Candidatus Cloacimonas sp.]|nr:hypothetical protein [Candidatus Cloacimonas sp.]
YFVTEKQEVTKNLDCKWNDEDVVLPVGEKIAMLMSPSTITNDENVVFPVGEYSLGCNKSPNTKYGNANQFQVLTEKPLSKRGFY